MGMNDDKPAEAGTSGLTDPLARPRRDFLKMLLAGTGASAMASETLLAQGAGAPFVVPSTAPLPKLETGSDVGTLWPFIEKLAARSYFPLAFTQPQFRTLKHWKQVARMKVLDLLQYTPPKWSTQGQTIKTTDRGDYVLEKVQFNTSPYFRVPAYVLVPKDAARRQTPAVIALHDHSGFYLWGKEKLVEDEDESPVLREFKQRYYAGRSLATGLVRQGYLVIVIDLMYWGERRMVLDDDPDDWRTRPANIEVDRVSAFNVRSSQYEPLVSRTLMAAGVTWPGLIFWDDIRTVDYLLTRSEVDRNRIGAIGFSLGGIRACYLGALDQRVKAAVVAGWMSSIPYQLRSDIKFSIGYSMLVPGLHRYLDYPDVAAMNAPNPLLIMMGKQDGIFNAEGVFEGYQKLKKSYEKANHSDRLILREFEAGHVLSAEMQQAAGQFFADYL
ncbi:MAG: hypothetical protein M2R45_03329 [Verrucomicrobia subdivision 3 bacterium]|nr:hypothetical protein [Limisphaerales bacterium]MCS1415390.1 hypothetical protein [Limisphaerales bacterium]